MPRSEQRRPRRTTKPIHNPHRQHERTKTALDSFRGSGDLKDACDISTAERSSADAKTVGPAVTAESAHEVFPRIIARARGQLIGGTTRIEGLRIDLESVRELFRKDPEEHS